jgi:hypothetical protein
MSKPKKFTYNIKNTNKFFHGLEIGEIFTFSNTLMFQCLENAANKCGVKIEYCDPGTPEYEEHGYNTARRVE